MNKTSDVERFARGIRPKVPTSYDQPVSRSSELDLGGENPGVQATAAYTQVQFKVFSFCGYCLRAHSAHPLKHYALTTSLHLFTVVFAHAHGPTHRMMLWKDASSNIWGVVRG